MKADLVIKNGFVVDVFNQELLLVDVAIVDGYIAGLGQYDGEIEIDAKNKYICPAFIDGHVHIESSMVTPVEFAKVVLPHGVTTIIADPHEIANVAGVEGLKFMLDASESLPLNVFYMLPSCVPATPFENAGAVLLASDLAPFYHHPRVLGLGEVMDYPSVHDGSKQMIDKLSGAHRFGKKIDGHAAGLHGQAIDVYSAIGIKTDHEAVSVSEAKERLQKGMYVIIRQGSVAKDLPNLISVVNGWNSRRCLFGTDDKHIDDLMSEGSIDHHVRLSIEYGMDPIAALTIATLNAAECYGLTNKGAIAPGYEADFLILEDLEKVKINQVYAAGKLAAENGKIVCAFKARQASELTQSVNIKPITEQDLSIPLTKTNKANIIEIIPNSLITKHVVEEVVVKQGFFVPSIFKDQLKMAVIERHHSLGNIGLGIVKGLKLKQGAIATTIAHDSHNLIVTGTNDDEILFAIEAIQKIGGGLMVVRDKQILAQLPLAIGGIISEEDYLTVYHQLSEVNHALAKLGASHEFNPFLTLSFLALPVIPQLKLTDLGLFDVQSFQHIGIEAGN
ncbi:adenine deaminase [Bacillus sp. DNRA2]|uniref:adenine deaminase n=1 Tax=Bacillus sp. DNRA2 TaxID=2723053 RepID=UPI00145E98B3|nr:adenine deaminase [Bacillus sp. DNRA2]NMD69912.1 adenine deaminase [Bacillus sp. DNRA2]